MVSKSFQQNGGRLPSLCSSSWRTFSRQREVHVDRDGFEHFRQRGLVRWVDLGGGKGGKGGGEHAPWRAYLTPEVVVLVVGAAGGGLSWIYVSHVEVVPYTHRAHLVLLSREQEKRMGETYFQQIKGEFRRSILPPVHPDAVRVHRIASAVIKAALEDVDKDAVEVGIEYSNSFPQGERQEGRLPSIEGTESSAKHFPREVKIKDGREEEEASDNAKHLDDSHLLQKTRMKGLQKGTRPSKAHLKGLKWEVVVIDRPVLNAFCLPGGKIVVYTGLLRKMPRDDEIATVLGHEVGHIVARHGAERLTKEFFILAAQLVVLQFIYMPSLVDAVSTVALTLPFSRMHELEADRIGVLLMAGAGFNPSIAPSVYEKLDALSKASPVADFVSTHPSGSRRANLLRSSAALEDALALYKSKQAPKSSYSSLFDVVR